MLESLRLNLERLRDRRGWSSGNPLVSVYIPTHDRADILLDRALPSAQAQTYDNIEVIVVSHGCTDGTAGRVRDMNNPRVRVLSIPREIHYDDTPENRWFAGPVDPCNAALKAVRGDWICRIDDDDVMLPHHIETLLRFAQRGNYEFVSAMHETHKGPVLPYDVDGIEVGGVQTWLYRSYLKLFKYNRDCWRQRRNKVNDTDLQARFRKAGVRMGYYPGVVARVLPRPGETEIGLKAYQLAATPTAIQQGAG